MRSSLVSFLALLAAATFAGSQPIGDLTVHEWGTFTSIAGADGRAVDWLPLDGPSDLPSFVDRACFSLKGSLPGTIRMETPVLYFYASRPVRANVRVEFRQGMVTEWFPHAAVTPSAPTGPSLHRRDFISTITWKDVTVLPGNDAALPVENAPSHYYAARRTGASLLQAAAEREKFLFYRGVGAFQPPVLAALVNDGTIAVTASDGDDIGDVVVFQNRGGAIASEAVHLMTSRSTLAVPAVPVRDDGAAASDDVEALLVSHGLYPAEARAMIETWRDSWFEEGTRLLYVASRKAVDAILPLTVEPAPRSIERVFVGRIELIDSHTMEAVKTALIVNDRTTLSRFGRFLQPISRRILDSSTPADRQYFNELLRFANPLWPDDRASSFSRCTQS